MAYPFLGEVVVSGSARGRALSDACAYAALCTLLLLTHGDDPPQSDLYIMYSLVWWCACVWLFMGVVKKNKKSLKKKEEKTNQLGNDWSKNFTTLKQDLAGQAVWTTSAVLQVRQNAQDPSRADNTEI